MKKSRSKERIFDIIFLVLLVVISIAYLWKATEITFKIGMSNVDDIIADENTLLEQSKIPLVRFIAFLFAKIGIKNLLILFFLILTIVSIYLISKSIKNGYIGLISIFTLFSLNFFSVNTITSMCITSFLGLSLYLLLKSDKLKNRRMSILFGVFFGLFFLIKYSVFLYSLPIVIYIICFLYKKNKENKINKKQKKNSLIVLLLVLIISGSWYVYHGFSIIKNYQSRIALDIEEFSLSQFITLDYHLYYFKDVIPLQIGFLFYLILISSILSFFFFNNPEHQLINSTFLLPLVILNLLPMKTSNHIAPLFLPGSIIFAVFISKLKWNKAISLLLVFICLSTFYGFFMNLELNSLVGNLSQRKGLIKNDCIKNPTVFIVNEYGFPLIPELYYYDYWINPADLIFYYHFYYDKRLPELTLFFKMKPNNSDFYIYNGSLSISSHAKFNKFLEDSDYVIVNKQKYPELEKRMQKKLNDSFENIISEYLNGKYTLLETFEISETQFPNPKKLPQIENKYYVYKNNNLIELDKIDKRNTSIKKCKNLTKRYVECCFKKVINKFVNESYENLNLQ